MTTDIAGHVCLFSLCKRKLSLWLATRLFKEILETGVKNSLEWKVTGVLHLKLSLSNFSCANFLMKNFLYFCCDQTKCQNSISILQTLTQFLVWQIQNMCGYQRSTVGLLEHDTKLKRSNLVIYTTWHILTSSILGIKSDNGYLLVATPGQPKTMGKKI